MKIFPAVDLYDGKAVRLRRGEYDKMTVYSDDPAEKAAEFRDKGAEYLHLVDLEGARDGVSRNFSAAAAIARLPGIKAELGGGIRDEDAIKRALDAGFFRVILGTSAIESFDFLIKMTEKYGDSIAVGADARDGVVAVRGWLESSGVEIFDFISRLETVGIKTAICTDISTDGAMSGTNTGLFKRLAESSRMDIIASGGVTTLEDVKALRKTGVRGAIIGRALYDGTIDLSRAIEVAE